jgi:hypothetical protein
MNIRAYGYPCFYADPYVAYLKTEFTEVQHLTLQFSYS